MISVSVFGGICAKPLESPPSRRHWTEQRDYLRMCAGVVTYGRYDIQTLLDATEEQGSLASPVIAMIFNEHESPVMHETRLSVGPGHNSSLE